MMTLIIHIRDDKVMSVIYNEFTMSLLLVTVTLAFVTHIQSKTIRKCVSVGQGAGLA